jgi:hypothetical protein
VLPCCKSLVLLPKDPARSFFSHGRRPIIFRQLSFYGSSGEIDRRGKLAEAWQRRAAAGPARTARLLASARQMGRHGLIDSGVAVFVISGHRLYLAHREYLLSQALRLLIKGLSMV